MTDNADWLDKLVQKRSAPPMSSFLNRPDIDETVKRLVDAAPPLTASQRDRLALLLRPEATE